jgi:hypothetical protein
METDKEKIERLEKENEKLLQKLEWRQQDYKNAAELAETLAKGLKIQHKTISKYLMPALYDLLCNSDICGAFCSDPIYELCDDLDSDINVLKTLQQTIWFIYKMQHRENMYDAGYIKDIYGDCTSTDEELSAND